MWKTITENLIFCRLINFGTFGKGSRFKFISDLLKEKNINIQATQQKKSACFLFKV